MRRRVGIVRHGARALRSLPLELRALPMRARPWWNARRAAASYRLLDEEELRATRRSETVFVFGSGASLNELSEAEWRHFERHDTLGFNWFVHQRFVRCDYQMVREISEDDFDPAVWQPQVDQYFRLVREAPQYDDTVFLVQSGFRAVNANRGLPLLPPGARIFRWRALRGRTEPSTSLRRGLVQAHSTLEECVNFAWLLGWRRIVLVGVDLYDRRYFWLDADGVRIVDRRRGASAADPHAQASTGMIELLGRWAQRFAVDGVELTVYNPRSLLAETLLVYEWASRSV
jgi:hypothetical protein